MPISSKELGDRFRDAIPRLLELRKASIELSEVGNGIRTSRTQKHALCKTARDKKHEDTID